jgi:hypothetical protein
MAADGSPRNIASLFASIANPVGSPSRHVVARYRTDEHKSSDVSLLIGLLGKLGFSPNERGKMNLPGT